MPIVYIHGIADRSDNPRLKRIQQENGLASWEEIEANLRQYVAPALADDPAGVPILRAYWGDVGAQFAWDGLSLISTPLPEAPQSRLADLDALTLGRELERLVLNDLLPAQLWPGAIRLIWELVDRPETFAQLRQQPDRASEINYLTRELEQTFKAELAQTSDWRAQWESLNLLLHSGWQTQVNQQLQNIRRPLEEFLTYALGDVLTYLRWCGNTAHPGPIPQRVLATLREAHALQQQRPGEPLVVLTYSMGGQILYDLLTHFIPNSPQDADLKVDFWAALGSQVALFEELKLFLNSQEQYSAAHGNKVPAIDPQRLGEWWNVWRNADFLSFRGHDIFEGISDTALTGTNDPLTSHTNYLSQVFFYRALAAKIQAYRDRVGQLPQQAESPAR